MSAAASRAARTKTTQADVVKIATRLAEFSP